MDGLLPTALSIHCQFTVKCRLLCVLKHTLPPSHCVLALFNRRRERGSLRLTRQVPRTNGSAAHCTLQSSTIISVRARECVAEASRMIDIGDQDALSARMCVLCARARHTARATGLLSPGERQPIGRRLFLF